MQGHRFDGIDNFIISQKAMEKEYTELESWKVAEILHKEFAC